MTNGSEMTNGTDVIFGECLLTTYVVRCPSALAIMFILRSIVVSLISVIATSFNLLFLVAFQRAPTIQSLTNRLLAYLSICDLLMSAFGMPVYVVRQVFQLYSMHDCVLFSIGRLLLLVLTPSSFVMLFVISFERFLAVVFPLKHSRWCNEKQAKMWFAIVILFCVLLLPILMLDLALYYAIVGSIVGFIVVQILSIYAVLYRSARKQRRRIRAMTTCWAPEGTCVRKGGQCFGERELSPVCGSKLLRFNSVAGQDVGSNEAEANLTGSKEAEVSLIAEVSLTGSSGAEVNLTGSNEAEVSLTGSNEAGMKSSGSINEEAELTGNNQAEVRSSGSNVPEERILAEIEAKPSKRFQWNAKDSFIFTLKFGILDRQETRNAADKKMQESGIRAPEVKGRGTGTSFDVTIVSEAESRSEARDYKAERTISIILLFMILCYLPAVTFVIYAKVSDASVYSWYTYGSWTEVLVMFNCCCNPCIYYWRNCEIRRAVINVLPNCLRSTAVL